METLQDKRVRLQPECKKRLQDRIDMWSYAAKVKGFLSAAPGVASKPLYLPFSVWPAGGASRGLLRPGRAGDDLPIQELHPAGDHAQRVRALPGRADLRPPHQAGDERTEGPVEAPRGGTAQMTRIPPSFLPPLVTS